MLKGFKEFVMRGNVVDLAVGVVIGASFGGVVNSLVKDIITPLIGALVKAPDFSGLYFIINSSKFTYGLFLNALISFIIIAFSIYFFVVIPLNKISEKMKKGDKPVESNTKECPDCISIISIKAKRCPYCTSTVN